MSTAASIDRRDAYDRQMRMRPWPPGLPQFAFGVLMGVLWIAASVIYLTRGDFDAWDAVIAGSGVLAALGLIVRGWRRLREPGVRPADR